MPTKSLSDAAAGSQKTSFENALQDCVVSGLLAIDSEDRIVALTGEAERAIRPPAGGKQPPSLHTLPLPVQALIREVQRTGQFVADRQLVLHSTSAGVVALSVSAIPLGFEKQSPGVVVILKDVSTAGKLEQNLRRLERLASVGTLTASMAHEIKNALVAIKTFIEMHFDKSDDADLAKLARSEMNRVNSILGHILKFAAPAPPTFSAVQLHNILDQSLRLVRHRIGGRVITFNRQFNARSDACRGDDHQLQQAFVNLLFNAVDALGSEGALSLSTDLISDETEARLHEGSGPAKWIRVRVTDNGVGMPAENLGRIFEPFFTTKPGGTGLGLTVTRGIIGEHQGTIHVESQPGRGTTFTILLPTK